MSDNNGPDSVLTVEGMLAAFEAVKALMPIHWYVTSDVVSVGKFFQVRPSRVGFEMPDYWLLHPDDFARLKAQTPMVQWKHIREWRAT